jgi:hypothetical protein
MIPALYDLPKLAKLDQGEQRWMLEVQLVRERNRIADALGDCSALVDATLSRI